MMVGERLLVARDKFGIREKILATFVIMALIPLIIMCAVTFVNINSLGDSSVEDSSDALRTQAITDLTTQTENRASQCDQFFFDIQQDTQMLTNFANDLYNHPSRYETVGYPSFKYFENTVEYMPEWGYVQTANDQRKGAWADWDSKVQACPYLNSSVVSRAEQDPAYATWLRSEINLTLQFDHVFKPMYDNNQPNVVLVWMVRHGGLTNSYSDPPLDYGQLLKDGDLTDDWDEDAEDYVTLANNRNNPEKKVIWTDPYYDTVGNGWLVSCIGPIYKGSEFIGTVGIDIQLDTILETVLGISMYKTGHAFLINADGITIAHQDLDDARDDQMDVDPEDIDVDIRNLESGTDAFDDLVDGMDENGKGVETVEYEEGEKNYIGYKKLESTGFILGVVVSEEEVLESVEESKDNIESTTFTTIIGVLVIDAIALVAILIVGLVMANRIVTPINKMINVADKIGRGEIDDKIMQDKDMQIDASKAADDEIGSLMKSFTNMVSSINKNMKQQKDLKKKEEAPIPKKLVQQINIEIKDSVINRSTIGTISGGGGAKQEPSDYCLSCGKDLPGGYSGKFCPHCGDQL
jgi:HAMP domain-containing protein